MTTIRASIKMFGGRVQRLTHRSAVTKTDMDFTVFVPPQASSNKKVPTLYWLSGLTYVFFKSFTFTQIFNTLDIQTTYMYIYSISISLVTHSPIHTFNQAIMDTYLTLEPQVYGRELLDKGWSSETCGRVGNCDCDAGYVTQRCRN